MPTEEAVLSVTIAFAPYDRVMPAVVGLFRARFGYSIAEPCPGESQIARLKRLEAEETQANVIHVNSTLVSEPAGSSGITLIEDWFGIWASELGSLLPDVTFLSLFSLFESKGCEQHRFTLRRGPDTLSEVDLDRNMCKSGWCWHEKGAPQPWEDAARSVDRAFQKFPDDPATEALARRAIAETGTLKHGVSEVEVLRMRPQMAAARGKTDIVKRYREMIRVAKSPAELAEASVEIYALRDPDVDHQFKINAMDEFLRAAIKRDPVHRSTNDLARMLDHLAAHAGQVPKGATGPGTHLLDQALSKAGR